MADVDCRIPCQLHLDCFEPCTVLETTCAEIKARGPGVGKFTPGKENDTVSRQYYVSLRNSAPKNKRKFKRLNFSRGKEESQ